MSSPENELSYSAYADEAHRRYIEEARTVRADRRTRIVSEGNGVDNESNTDSPDTTDNTDPESSSPEDRSDSPNLLNLLNLSNSSDSSDLSIIEIEDSTSPNYSIKGERNAFSGGNSILHVEDLHPEEMRRTKSVSPLSKLEQESRVGRAGRAGRVGRVGRAGRVEHLTDRSLIPNYNSDITSDDNVLLREFGDSEGTIKIRTSNRQIEIDGLHSSDNAPRATSFSTPVSASVSTKKTTMTQCYDDPLGVKKVEPLDFEAMLMQEMQEIAERRTPEERRTHDERRTPEERREKPVKDTENTKSTMESEILELERLSEELLDESTILDSVGNGMNSMDSKDGLLAALEGELSASLANTTDENVKKPKKRRSRKLTNDDKPLPNPRKGTGGSRRMTKWESDDMTDKCYGCGDEFGMIYRRHHCRLCGRIFCHACSRYKTKLPMEIIKTIPDRPDTYSDYLFGKDWDPDEKVRVCGDCFKYTSNIIRVQKIIRVFELCGFNIVELCHLASLDDNWKIAAEFCIDKFTEIQYKLSIEDLTPMEKKYIWINRHLLSKHSRWMVLLFKSCDMTDSAHVAELQRVIGAPRKVSCLSIKCSRFCSENIQLGDMLDLVKFNTNNDLISEYVSHCITEIDNELLMDYLPFLITNAVNNIFMIDILLIKAREDFTFMTHIYWCIKAFITDLQIRKVSIVQTLRFIRDRCKTKFAERFKIMIKNEKMNMKWIETQNNEIAGKIIIPVCPTRDFTMIETENIRIMDSNSRPIIIPFRENDQRKLIMYKEDDIRKDYVVLGIINIIHRLLNKELQLNIDIVKYRVMPTSKKTGYIEIVENAETIYDIIQTQTIQNYILNHNEQITVAIIKDRFIKSTALYCVISYLFGFGDRHLENIMISETGLLFHIDFGYILGQDPKYTTNKALRVTPEIINVIGGKNTANYHEFSRCCTQIYTCLRRHVNLFSNLLSVVPLIDPTITEDRVKREIFDRFEVGENNSQAVEHMDLKVKRDSGSFDYIIIDFLHNSKNTTLFKGLRYVAGILGSAYSNEST